MAATADETARARLGELMTQRRLDLRLSANEAARLSSVGIKTWNRAAAGRPVRDVSYVGIDAGLRWEPGSCRTVLAGGEPKPLPDDAPSPPAGEEPELVYADDSAEDWLPVIGDDLRESVREATMTTAPGLTGAEVQEIERRVEEGLRRRLAERHRHVS
ncbi:hypothetical protein [Embleya sp. NPDC020630]|uniref:hypothetical protein n=1 Tax=Embleya sp. NPDC020630 TaxID=3363979 RepID=UPI0037B468EA